ncbi:MAG: hypothetical protein ACT4P5_00405 [Armatimonadota bacterium]
MPGTTRGEVATEFIETWKAAGIPPADIIRAMTVTGYKVSETNQENGVGVYETNAFENEWLQVSP